jgi:hypothetical protein
MPFTLFDDGTLDTILLCDGCGKEFRYNASMSQILDYDDFVEDCKALLEDEHICGGLDHDTRHTEGHDEPEDDAS